MRIANKTLRLPFGYPTRTDTRSEADATGGLPRRVEDRSASLWRRMRSGGLRPPLKTSRATPKPSLSASEATRLLSILTAESEPSIKKALNNLPPPVTDANTHFQYGGTNESSAIRTLQTLAVCKLDGSQMDLPFDKLDRRLKPAPAANYTGYIKPDDSLRALLERDNDVVRGARMTHRALATFLQLAANEWDKAYQNREVRAADYAKSRRWLLDNGGTDPSRPEQESHRFQFDERQFEIKGASYKGLEQPLVAGSPWSGRDYILSGTAADGRRIEISFAQSSPSLISHWGFYQNGMYRVAPEELLGLLATSQAAETSAPMGEPSGSGSPRT